MSAVRGLCPEIDRNTENGNLKELGLRAKRFKETVFSRDYLKDMWDFTKQRRERKSSRQQEEAWTILRDIRLALANRCGR